MRKKRIMWANSYCLLDTSSGASISVRQILKQLQQNGYEIDIVGATLFDNPRGVERITEAWETIKTTTASYVNIADGNLTHRLTVTKSTARDEMSLNEANLLYNLYTTRLHSFKPDLVMFYGGQPWDFFISSEARVRGIPSVAYLVNANYMGIRWCRDVDLIITDTHATADLYKQKQGFEPKPVGKFIDPGNVIAKKHDRKHVLMVNPTWYKGGGIVAMIALILEKTRPDITFEVVESRGNWKEFVKVATSVFEGKEREKLDNVILTGNTDRMDEVYARARLLLAPSLWWESGSRVLAEAMLNGIPSIVTNHGGSPEMVGDGGFVFDLPANCFQAPYTNLPDPNQLEDVVKLIIELFDNESLYLSTVTNAMMVGYNKHGIENSTKKLMDTLEPLLRKKAGDKNMMAKLKSHHKHNLKEEHKESKFQLVSAEKLIKRNPKKLFIDCGGYDGCSAIKFLLKNPGYDTVTFEPNPALHKYYSHVPSPLVKCGVSTKDGTAEFLVDDIDGDGSSLIREKKIDWHGLKDNDEFNSIKIRTINLSRLIDNVKDQYSEIHLKLDIEGAEYDILEGLVEDGNIRHVTRLYCEFHWQKCGFPKQRHDELIGKLEQHTSIEDWDALDYAIHSYNDNEKVRERETYVASRFDLDTFQQSKSSYINKLQKKYA